MPSITEIYNGALAECGRFEVTDPDEDTIIAQACRTRYPGIRDKVLKSHPWDCALEQVSLPVSGTAPTYGWLYAYQLPANPYCLQVDSVQDDVEYKVMGRFIYTDEPAPLRITYRKRVEPDELDAGVSELIIKELAVAICMRVTEDLKRKNELTKELRALKKEMRSTDAQQGTPDKAKNGTFVTARRRGRG